ncbi:Protein smg7, partial [Irineochytrium annulatum]
DAVRIEEELRKWDQQKRAERRILLKDAKSELLRQHLLELYEDILAGDRAAASHPPYHERLWTVVFYNRIEELRRIVTAWEREKNEALAEAMAEMNKHLDMAANFYRIFILLLLSRIDDDISVVGIDLFLQNRAAMDPADIDERRDRLFNLVHHSIICLGDLERYRSNYRKGQPQYLQASVHLYRQAIRVNPNNGKPYSQLAILAMNGKNYIDALYWYSLSMANNSPFPVAANNLHSFHRIVTAKMDSAVALPDQLSFSESSVANVFIQYHRMVVFPEDEALARLETFDQFFPMQSAVEKSFTRLLSIEVPLGVQSASLLQMLVILIIGYVDMNARFQRTDKANLRNRIRSCQVFILSTIFDISVKVLDLVYEFLIGITEAPFSPFISENENGSRLALLAPVGIVSVWITRNLDILSQFQKYTTQERPLQPFSKKILEFSRSLANVVNCLSAFADMDGSFECLPEDSELLGVAPLRSYYASMSPRSMMKVLKKRMMAEEEKGVLRVSRVAHLAKQMSESSTCDFFYFDDKNESKFKVRDEETRKQERRNFAQALAVELLKDQIGSLENSLSQLKDENIPVVVFDANCFVYNLPAIKSVLMDRSCKVVIPQEVVDQLDRMKKGTAAANARARDAIRYLEQRFKYKSDYLVAQQDGEKEDAWSKDGKAVGSVVGRPDLNNEGTDVEGEDGREDGDPAEPQAVTFSVPARYRDLLRCCVYYWRHNVPEPVDKDDKPFVLVTEDDDLLDVAAALGMQCMQVRQWSQWIKRRRRR